MYVARTECCRRLCRAILRRFSERQCPAATCPAELAWTLALDFQTATSASDRGATTTDSFQANSRVEWAVSRDRIGVYGDYYYYALHLRRDHAGVAPRYRVRWIATVSAPG